MIDYTMQEVQNKITYWNVINYVSLGWLGIEKNITDVIKREDSETATTYDYRTDKLTYFDNFNPILNGINGLVFAKPLGYENVPTEIEKLFNDIDNQGTQLNTFAGEMFKKAEIKGIAFVYVDMKKAEVPKNKAQQIKENLRPYFVHIEPENVTAWKFDENGLSMVKIREFVTQDDPENIYATVEVEQYRVLYKGYWELWQVVEDEEIKIDTNTTAFNEIPFYTLNLKKETKMTAGLPFYDLAKLCIRHTQMFTDLSHSLHLANVPMLFFSGYTEDEAKLVKIGANKAFYHDSPEADIKYITLDINTTENTNTILEKLENQMLNEGLKVLSEDGTNNITATEANINATQKQSKLNTWINELENTLSNMLNGLGLYYGLKDCGRITIDADIASVPLTAQEIQAYTNLVANQGLSMETLFGILKRRKNIMTDNEWKEEQSLIETDGLLTPKVI